MLLRARAMFHTVAKFVAFGIIEVVLIAEIARDTTHARNIGYRRRMNDDLIARKLQIKLAETFASCLVRCRFFCQDHVDLCLRDTFCCRYFYLCHNTIPLYAGHFGLALVFLYLVKMILSKYILLSVLIIHHLVGKSKFFFHFTQHIENACFRTPRP